VRRDLVPRRSRVAEEVAGIGGFEGQLVVP